MASSTKDVFCLCRKPYNKLHFMIECDICLDWFHGTCVNVLEHQATDIDSYHCPTCELTHGPTVLKQRMNWYRHDYSEIDEDEKAVQTGTHAFIKNLKLRTFSSAKTVVQCLSGDEVTVNYFHENGFNFPILVEKKEGLNLTLPPVDITIAEIEQKVGSFYEIDVIDVARQEDNKMMMWNWTEYFSNPARSKILNVISLEFSKTDLSKLVEPPHIVKQISWISQFWPKDLPGDLMPERPSVQKYCLMGVGDSFTDFHIDFGGSSVWYHVLRGEKVFFFIEPTAKNLEIFENWLVSSNRTEKFFGDQVGKCYKLVLKQGQTLLVPTGWIHAVHTTADSLVFGGNFLHSFSIPLQLKVYDLELRVNTSSKYLFPSYEAVNWYAAKHILDTLSDDNIEAPSYLVEGLAALVCHLKKWTNPEDLCNKYVCVRKKESLAGVESVQYRKLLTALNSHLQMYELKANAKQQISTKANKLVKKWRKKKHKKRRGSVKGESEDLMSSSSPPKTIKMRMICISPNDTNQCPNVSPVKVATPATANNVQKKGLCGLRKTTVTWSGTKHDLSSLNQSNTMSVNSSGSNLPLTEMADGTIRLSSPAEESDSDDGEALVVDEGLEGGRKCDSIKLRTERRSLRMKLSIKAKESHQGVLRTSVAPAVPTAARGHLCGRITDTLTASRHRDECSFTQNDDNSVRSRIKALDGLLSVGDLSMVAPVPDSSPTDLPDSHLAKFSCASNFIDEDDDDDEKRLMADCIQDGDFIYPSFDMSDDEKVMSKKGKVQEKDDAWHPKGRVNVPKIVKRQCRVGTRKESVTEGLAATARKPSQSKQVGNVSTNSALQKSVDIEPIKVEPSSSGMPADHKSSINAFRPRGRLPVDTTPSPSAKPKKPRKGEATSKQRLAKILKL